MSRPVCIDDYRALARRRIPKVLFDYIDGGAFDELTMARNRGDLQDLVLRQRVMRDVSQISLQTEIFGQTLALPVILGPVGASGLWSHRGEAQAAKAAAAAGTTVCLSTMSICDIDETTAGAGAPIWFQLYMIRDRGFMKAMLGRAKAANCPVLVFTVDLPLPGIRYRSARSSMGGQLSLIDRLCETADALSKTQWLRQVYFGGWPPGFGNLAGVVDERAGFAGYFAWLSENFDPSINWDDIAWIRQHWDGPVVIKGILDPEDAVTAVDLGVDGLVVSNHGGRQLDSALSSAAALPAIVDAVGDRTTVLMDGGIRTGLDVVKALALGAKACLIGRAWAYPLAAEGGAGVAHALEILRREMMVAMALTGCTDVRNAGRDMLA